MKQFLLGVMLLVLAIATSAPAQAHKPSDSYLSITVGDVLTGEWKIASRDLDYAIGVGLRMLLLRRIVEEKDGLYRPNPADAALLAYYANAIEPLIVAAGPGSAAVGKAA